MSSKIAVVGAGMAGLSAARRLADTGFAVTVFDKGRSIGGRLSTRAHDDISFDHGAPYVHADRAAFEHMLEGFVGAGSAAHWPVAGSPTVTGLPGMNGLLGPWCDGLELHTSTAVTGLVEGAEGWTVARDGASPMLGFDAVVVAIPAEQADALTAPLGLGWSGDLAPITYAPCMTMMVAFEERLPLDDMAKPAPGYDLEKQIRNGTKPNRPSRYDQWVVHADRAWSETHLNTSKDEIADALLARFAAANSLTLPPHAYLGGHRWKFARTTKPLGQSHLYDPVRHIGLCGDWCLGPNAEHAFESGLMLAEAVRQSLE